jgi:hypothetical protein
MAKNGNVAHPGKKLSLHLTRIRPNFWVFQEKCPIFGSNPIELWFRGGKIKKHAVDSSQWTRAKQTEIAQVKLATLLEARS